MRALAPALAVSLAPAAAAQVGDDPSRGETGRLSRPAEAAGKSKPDRTFVVMPIPLSDPQIGTGLGLVGMALYNKDAGGHPTTTGAGVIYTDTESWAALAFHKMHLADDRFRLTAGGGYGEFNVDFYGIGVDAGGRGVAIGLHQEGGGGVVDFLARVAPNFYAGARYRGVFTDTTLQNHNPLFPDLELPPFQLKSGVSMLGLSAEYDTRDSEYGPRKGLYATGQWLFADEAFGSDFNYDQMTATANGYMALGEETTLAWRASVCSTGAGTPFYDLCLFGTQHDLRGYPGGQYRDSAMYAVQAELRRPLFWRFGGVAFAGFGEVARGFDKLSADEILPSAGVGLRFEASKEYRVNLSIDYAVGDATSALYFYIGEAF